jgi:hypothetical protein
MIPITVGMRVKPKHRWAPLDPDSIIGTVIQITPKGHIVYVRMRDGSVQRWRRYEVEVVE